MSESIPVYDFDCPVCGERITTGELMISVKAKMLMNNVFIDDPLKETAAHFSCLGVPNLEKLNATYSEGWRDAMAYRQGEK